MKDVFGSETCHRPKSTLDGHLECATPSAGHGEDDFCTQGHWSMKKETRPTWVAMAAGHSALTSPGAVPTLYQVISSNPHGTLKGRWHLRFMDQGPDTSSVSGEPRFKTTSFRRQSPRSKSPTHRRLFLCASPTSPLRLTLDSSCTPLPRPAPKRPPSPQQSLSHLGCQPDPALVFPFVEHPRCKWLPCTAWCCFVTTVES